MAHIIFSLKGSGTECVTMATKCLAFARDHVFSVLSVWVDSDK